MIYACEKCGFLFYRVGEVDECPSCENKKIRLATKAEAAPLREFLETEGLATKPEKNELNA